VGQTNWNPNGSLGSFQITDTVPGTSDTQSCSDTHDDLSRVSSVNCMNGTTNKWNQNFSYDAFGNITKTTSGPGISFQPTYDTSKNWITALPGITTTTDNNGQVTYDGTHNYTWDSAGKMHQVDSTTLTHDALGRMVETVSGSAFTQILYSPTGGKFALMNGQTLVKGYVPLPGAQAVYTSTGLTYYRHQDHLGSSRLATTPSRTLYSSTAYAPYGEPYAQAGTTDLSFTGHDQDTVSGIHDSLFRKYAPVQSRWLSPDPAGLAAVDPSTPQTWNRYAYVAGSPLGAIDPLGLCPDYEDCGDGLGVGLDGSYDPGGFGYGNDPTAPSDGSITVDGVPVNSGTAQSVSNSGAVQTGSTTATYITYQWFPGSQGSYTAADGTPVITDTIGGWGVIATDTITVDDPPGDAGGGNGIGSYPNSLSKAWNAARMLLSNLDCAKFLKGILGALNQPQNLDALLANFDDTKFVLAPAGSPNHSNDFTAHVNGLGQSSTVYVGYPSAADVVPTLMHEVFHTVAYGFSDQALSGAIGKPVSGNSYDAMKTASRNFSSAMNAACK